jgi:hypothetical protein
VQKVFAVTIAEMITIKIRVTTYKPQIGTWMHRLIQLQHERNTKKILAVE